MKYCSRCLRKRCGIIQVVNIMSLQRDIALWLKGILILRPYKALQIVYTSLLAVYRVVAKMATKEAWPNPTGEHSVSAEVYSTSVEVYTSLKAIQSSLDSLHIPPGSI